MHAFEKNRNKSSTGGLGRVDWSHSATAHQAIRNESSPRYGYRTTKGLVTKVLVDMVEFLPVGVQIHT